MRVRDHDAEERRILRYEAGNGRSSDVVIPFGPQRSTDIEHDALARGAGDFDTAPADFLRTSMNPYSHSAPLSEAMMHDGCDKRLGGVALACACSETADYLALSAAALAESVLTGCACTASVVCPPSGASGAQKRSRC